MLTIENRRADSLIAYVRNPRAHSADQVAQIAASIAEFGFVNPILIGADNVVIAGHGRLRAAERLGLAQVPVIVLARLSDAQRRALVIADNKLAENASWDDARLQSELAVLQRDGFDLDLLGFAEDELGRLLDGMDADPTRPDGDGADDSGGDGDSGPLSGALAARFGVPPFSVLEARKGWWQERKRAWIALGIRSELGRGAAPGGSPRPLDRGWTGGGVPANMKLGTGLIDQLGYSRPKPDQAAVNRASAFEGQARLDRFREKPRAKAAAPGGSPMPATDYRKSKARGDGRGRPLKAG